MTRLYLTKVLAHREKLHQLAIEQQQALLFASVKGQEKERSRIAADLHDDLMSKLNVLSLISYTGMSRQDMQGLIKESIATARRISHDLAPPMLDKTTLYELITEQVEGLQEGYELQVRFNTFHEPKLSAEFKLQVLRVVQEALNNIIKHAEASSILIQCRISRIHIALRIQDNGLGHDIEKCHKGLGMKNIETRMQLLGGSHKMKNLRTGGSCLIIQAPFN